MVVLSLSWHNSAAHGMVCRQVLAAARNTQRVVLCCVQQRVWECAAAGGAPRKNEPLRYTGIPPVNRGDGVARKKNTGKMEAGKPGHRLYVKQW